MTSVSISDGFFYRANKIGIYIVNYFIITFDVVSQPLDDIQSRREQGQGLTIGSSWKAFNQFRLTFFINRSFIVCSSICINCRIYITVFL